ncbi:MAG: radical SAM protein [Endomicrobia bacterium]|nr:radical SAM protein [Endomicrobiia bacterium]
MNKFINFIRNSVENARFYISRNFFGQNKHNSLKRFLKKIFSVIYLTKFIPDSKLRHLEVHITEHCNLNCAYCDHFCPIAKEEFLDVQTFEKDMKRMSELTDKNIDEIVLLGGEPLLNKDVNSFMEISRKYFPKSSINITTNGLLLLSISHYFWETCKKYNIDILISKYPIDLNCSAIEQKAKDYGVNIIWTELKTMWHTPLNIEANGNKTFNFMNCMHSKCTFLQKGKIYMCPRSALIETFNKHFNKNIPVSDKDYIDIYKVNNISEILKFISNPVPFCKNCKPLGITYGHKWKKSENKIGEWI